MLPEGHVYSAVTISQHTTLKKKTPTYARGTRMSRAGPRQILVQPGGLASASAGDRAATTFLQRQSRNVHQFPDFFFTQVIWPH